MSDLGCLVLFWSRLSVADGCNEIHVCCWCKKILHIFLSDIRNISSHSSHYDANKHSFCYILINKHNIFTVLFTSNLGELVKRVRCEKDRSLTLFFFFTFNIVIKSPDLKLKAHISYPGPPSYLNLLLYSDSRGCSMRAVGWELKGSNWFKQVLASDRNWIYPFLCSSSPFFYLHSFYQITQNLAEIMKHCHGDVRKSLEIMKHWNNNNNKRVGHMIWFACCMLWTLVKKIMACKLAWS